MDVKIKKTNTTEASATLSHDDLVQVLGMYVKLDAGIPRDTAGTKVDVTITPVEGTDQFTAAVDVLVDHNYVAPGSKADASEAEPFVDATKSDALAEQAVPVSTAPAIPMAINA